GFAPERLAAMKHSGDVLEKNAGLFDKYVTDKSEVGILFTPRSSYLAWAQEGHDERIAKGLCGYARALTKLSIPLTFLESDNLKGLEEVKVLFLPRSIVIDDQLAEKLLAFAEQGGTLVAESECGAFDRHGFYRIPPNASWQKPASWNGDGGRCQPKAHSSVTAETTLNLPWISGLPRSSAKMNSASNALTARAESSILQAIPATATTGSTAPALNSSSSPS
ncbi:MAG: beta-galactosidase trimerization domain-containing protein, partial [Victivallales bacterium]|nr:beta-galactosidase trimerization domain-containing protein [Victivallales bacterium]